MTFRTALRADDLWLGEMKAVVVGGRAVVLLRVAGGVRAYDDRCAHRGVPLSEGELCGDVLTCTTHLWQYDARTGCGVNPESAQLRARPVRIVDGAIEVDIDADLTEQPRR
jgi:nitrite reductase/ring-hydroxylating ferredoxin subunit